MTAGPFLCRRSTHSYCLRCRLDGKLNLCERRRVLRRPPRRIRAVRLLFPDPPRRLAHKLEYGPPVTEHPPPSMDGSVGLG